jgi:tRNA threonylcarbamoyladenosine biosynthesis protein TsaE
MQTTVDTKTAEETEFLGEKIGKRLKGGEVIELISDLGGGKTTLTRGIARGAGSSDVVGSPTFTLSKVYKTQKFEIHHFDFYRLAEAGLMEHELHDLLGDQQTVVVVEWGDVVQHVLPDQRLTINLAQTADGDRQLTYQYPQTMAYLVAE